jgi:ubiquinone/menaquinone biosynthesis C-methylase UbiE
VIDSERRYYHRRAAEYDHWYLGTGRFADRRRPGWFQELRALTSALGALAPARVLDVACGTGFLTRHLRGRVVGVDQSPAMLEVARARAPTVEFREGDALGLPFADRSFDRVLTGHFYGHLRRAGRERFLAEARRVADELVVVDSARRPGAPPDGQDERALSDGSRHRVYKRHFTPEDLLRELEGGRVLLSGQWFVAVISA